MKLKKMHSIPVGRWETEGWRPLPLDQRKAVMLLQEKLVLCSNARQLDHGRVTRNIL